MEQQELIIFLSGKEFHPYVESMQDAVQTNILQQPGGLQMEKMVNKLLNCLPGEYPPSLHLESH